MTNYKVSSKQSRNFIAQILNSKKIDEACVQKLRLDIFSDGLINFEHAKAIILLEKSCTYKAQSWGEYYITSLSDFILCRVQPYGAIDDQNTEWLKENVAPLGYLQSHNEYRLLKCILERANPAMPEFCAFVLSQLHCVLSDYDPNIFLGDSLSGTDGAVSEARSFERSIEILDNLSKDEQAIEFS